MVNDSTPRISPLFLIVTVLFVTCLLISNIIAGKLASFFGIVMPAAVILFPITYIFGDILTEVYGFQRARLVIWLGFSANLLMALVFTVALALPHPGFWGGQSAFTTVLGMTPRIVLASMLGYLAGSFCNSIVLSRLKILCGGRFLWLRTIGSTVVGEAFDTIVFLTTAFFGSIPFSILAGMMLAQYLWKVFYEAVLTPITYAIVVSAKKYEGFEHFDHGVRYNPFALRVEEPKA